MKLAGLLLLFCAFVCSACSGKPTVPIVPIGDATAPVMADAITVATVDAGNSRSSKSEASTYRTYPKVASDGNFQSDLLSEICASNATCTTTVTLPTSTILIGTISLDNGRAAGTPSPFTLAEVTQHPNEDGLIVISVSATNRSKAPARFAGMFEYGMNPTDAGPHARSTRGSH